MTRRGDTRVIAPRAASLIESMRSIGYSLQTAVADIIDNSVTAGARKIELLADTDSELPALGVLDDGAGMDEAELLEAMRPGTRSPLDGREAADLGRFGLGLKTASFSQCRRLTVVARRNGATSAAIWDLDTVAERDEWLVEIPGDPAALPWSERLGSSGTLVVWQKLDRLTGAEDNRSNLVRQIDGTASHVEFVFHRFMSGRSRRRKIGIFLNGRELEPFDPFHSHHPATQAGAVEKIPFRGTTIRVQPYTLPHHAKVSSDEWDRYGGPEGYARNQGFYLYRNERLIVHGTWFGMARQLEVAKLCRVQIDIPNSLDAEWKIDVKKASAQPPPQVRERLRKIIEPMIEPSKRTYTVRGKRLVEGNRLPVWTRTQNKNEIFYGLNLEHPLFDGFMGALNEPDKQKFRRLIGLIVSTLPIDALFADIGENPQDVTGRALDGDSFAEIVKSTYRALRKGDFPPEKAMSMMQSAEPFRSDWQRAKEMIETIERSEE